MQLGDGISFFWSLLTLRSKENEEKRGDGK